MPARPWKDRSTNTDASLRARLRYLRKSNDELRGQVSKLNRENNALKRELRELRDEVEAKASPVSKR